MKNYLRSSELIELDVTIFADHPIFYLYDEGEGIVAAFDSAKYNLPTGPVISRYKNRITQQMIDDFESFMEDVEILCEEDYNLVGTYKHVSNDHSYYYNYLAKDDEGNIIVKFRLRLRISNHLGRKSKKQKYNKNQEAASEKLKEMLSDEDIRKLKKYTKTITINNEIFVSYEEAFEAIDSLLSNAVQVMKKGRR